MNVPAYRAQKKFTPFRCEELTLSLVLRLKSVHTPEADFANLPEDSQSLKAIVRRLLEDRDREQQRAEDLHIQNLRLQRELERYKK